MRTVKDYVLKETLGRGGMATVYRGEAPDGTQVAIKVINRKLESTTEQRRFEREASIRIENENVVKVLDAAIDSQGAPCIILELLTGETLAARLTRGPLTVEQIVDLGIQACRGLAAAHAEGVVHRDLSPSNLFLLEDGRVKVLDFGIALALAADDTRLTLKGTLIGKPAYASPEQARGQDDLDTRSDLWSLGVVLYEALTGVSPFQGRNHLASILSVIMDEPVPLVELLPSVPHALAAIIHRALFKERESRWQTADAMCHALGSVSLGGDDSELLGTRLVVAREETRVVTILLCRGVEAPHAIEREVRERRGRYIPLPDQGAIGLFGERHSVGDEFSRAVDAALSARHAAGAMAVAAGRTRVGANRLADEILELAEDGCSLELEGVAVDTAVAHSVRDRFTTRAVASGFHEVRSVHVGAALCNKTVGRAPELHRLQVELDTALEDRTSNVVLIHGAPGVGKSHLLREMYRMIRSRDTLATVLLGRAEPLQRSSNFSLLLSMIRNLLNMEPGYNSVVAPTLKRQRYSLRRHIRDALMDDAAVEECAELIGTLLRLENQDTIPAQTTEDDAQVIADRMRIAWQDYFIGLCRQQPLIMLLEDLQWADQASLAILEELVSRLGQEPFLVVGTVRSEGNTPPSILVEHDPMHIRLRGLKRAEVAQLACQIADTELSASLLHQLYDHTGGNPFFVEQIVMTLRDKQLVASALETLPMPSTVEAAVQSRFDQLLPGEKEICKKAAILRRPFSVSELQAFGIQHADSLVSSLRKRGLIELHASHDADGAQRLRFKSTLISEVAYRMNTEEHRTALHRRAAEYIDGQTASMPEEAATHYELGGQFELAATRFTEAALQASQRADTSTVIHCAERALALGVARNKQFELHMARAEAVRFLEQRDYQRDALVAAIDAAGNASEKARALTEMASLFGRLGQLPRALTTIQQAVAHAQTAADPLLLVKALGWQTLTLARSGRTLEAEQALARAKAVIVDPTPRQRAWFAEWQGKLAGFRGDLGDRRDAFRQAVERYNDIGDLRRAAGARVNLADVYNRVGAYEKAETTLGVAIEDCRRVGNSLMECYAFINRGYALTKLERYVDALQVIDHAIELGQCLQENVVCSVVAPIYRCYAMLGTAEIARLPAVALEAADVARKAGLLDWRALALTVAARAYLMTGHKSTALELSRQAMSMRDEVDGTEEDEAEVFLTYIESLEWNGLMQEAREVRQRAIERIQSISARIGDGELRRQFLEEVPAHRALLRGTLR